VYPPNTFPSDVYTIATVFPLLQHLSKYVYPLNPSSVPFINNLYTYFLSNNLKNSFLSFFYYIIFESRLGSK